jgi:MFS transporter, NNP family, nitrate/nitrite transporter
MVGCFFCFGPKSAILTILGAFYFKKFPDWGQRGTGNWASMFGLLHLVVRSMGGLVSDTIYRPSGSWWNRECWLLTMNGLAEIFMCLFGFLNPIDRATIFGLFTGLAFSWKRQMVRTSPWCHMCTLHRTVRCQILFWLGFLLG